MLGHRGRYPSSKAMTKRKRRERPGVSGVGLHDPKRSSSARRSVEQPSRPSQRVLDLGEVADPHHLEEKLIDLGFEAFQGGGPTAPWPTIDDSGGVLPRSSELLARGGCPGRL